MRGHRWVAAALAIALGIGSALTGASPASAATVSVPAICADSVSSLTVQVGDIVQIPVQGAGCTLVNNSATGNLDRVSANGFVAFAEGSGAVFALVVSSGTQYLNKVNVTITAAPRPTASPTPSGTGTASAAGSPTASAQPTPSATSSSAMSAPNVLAPESTPLPSQRLTAKDISFESGPADRTLVLTSDNGNPLQLLSVSSTGGPVDVVSSGTDFANPANWQQLGYGDICWGNTGFGNATAAVLPVATPPFRTVPADWALSAAIVVTTTGNSTFLTPMPGQVVATDGSRIRSLILCSRAVAADAQARTTTPKAPGNSRQWCHVPPGNPSATGRLVGGGGGHENHPYDYRPINGSCNRTLPVIPTPRPPLPVETPVTTPDPVVSYCRATGSDRGPYELAQTTESLILAGKVGVAGPLYPQPGWGDVIPPFNGFRGVNWPAGLNLLSEERCELPDLPQVQPTPTVTPVATATAVATPVATPTGTVVASPTASPLLTPTPVATPTPPLRPQPTVIASPTVPQATPALPAATPTPTASAPVRPPVVVAPTLKPDRPTLPVVSVPEANPKPQSSTASPTATPTTKPSSSVAATPTPVPSTSTSAASPLASPPTQTASATSTSSPTPSAVVSGSATSGPGPTGPGGSPEATPVGTAIPTPGLVTLVVTNGPSTVTIKVPFTTLEHKVSKPTRHTDTATEHLATTGRDDLMPAVATIVLIAGAGVIVLRRRRWATATAVTLLVIGLGTSSQAAWSAVSESRAYDTAQAQAAGSWKASGAIASLSFRRAGGDRPVSAREMYVFRGVDAAALAKGPGWYTSTARPGTNGNLAIAGHRTGFGSPFAHLDEARAGDEITVRTADGSSVTYVVRRVTLVAPDADWVLGPDPLGTGEPTLTLTTCDPPHVNSHRLIVFATTRQ